MLAYCARTSITADLGDRDVRASIHGGAGKVCTAFFQKAARVRCAEVIHSHPWGRERKQSDLRNPACGGAHTFTPLRRHNVYLMERECWIHKDKNRKVIVLMPPSPARHVTLCFQANHLAEMKTLRIFQFSAVCANINFNRQRDMFPCFSKQIFLLE